MRVLSYNIHRCIGRRGIEDPDGILAVIRESRAHVVALQEVQDESSTGRSFLRRLRDELDYPHIIYGITMQSDAADYGNILMTRLPVRSQERIDLSQQGREPRGATRVSLDHEGREFEVIATHLGLLPRERLEQVRQLTSALPATIPPGAVRILVGDLNEWLPLGRTGRLLRSTFGDAGGPPTFPAGCPLLKLDRIHVLPETVRVDRRTLSSRASDHLPLLADLTCE